MSNWSNIAARVNAAQLRTFGEEVYYQGAGGKADPVAITVIWNDNEAEMPKGVDATLWTVESNFNPAPRKNDIVRRGDFEYRLVDPPENGIGGKRTGDGAILIYLRQTGHAANT